jgi:serine/threonine protein kinase/Tfp pilus assembly protein PilF
MTWSLNPGDVLGHYRVLSPLGSGGMAQVYLAEDVRLGRRLALKVLSTRTARDEERVRRFEREARAISGLNHPNILTVYDVGYDSGMQFIATEYIEGETLRTLLEKGRLDVRQTVNIGTQIAEAIAAAHGAGVIHRDLKPENVMVRADGYVKVLDFGLAKLTNDETFTGTPANASTMLGETRDGVVMGTFKYMAPEQARGGDLDARADLFALGALLYEMLAGQSPFDGPTAADIVGAILFREPDPLGPRAGVPDQLDRIVMTALRKDRNERYQTCGDLLQDLRALARALDAGSAITHAVQEPSKRPRRRRARHAVTSLAVLPLTNLSQQHDLDYFADGLTESLINSLSQIPRLRVMARSTVFRFKGRDPNPQTVAKELGVQAVLVGRVAQRANEFVVSAELVDADDGSQLWGTTLNRRDADIVVLQAEIVEELTNALRVRMSRDEATRLRKRYTVNPEAYQLYLRGRYFLNMRTGESLRHAQTLFEAAIVEDPKYALAHAGLADCCALIAVSLRAASVSTLVEYARGAAMNALRLDDGLAEGHASMAFIKFRFDWDWVGAEAEFTRALDLNAGHAPSRQWYAMFLASRGRFDDALAQMRRAMELDPLSLIIQSGIGRILHFAGRYDEAIVQYEHVLQTNASFGQAHVDLALTHMARGELDAARAELDRGAELLGDVSTIVLLRGCCAGRQGRNDEGRSRFQELERRYEGGQAGADDLATLAAVLGDWPAAIKWLTDACAQRAPFLGYVDVEPAMRPLLEDPACRTLLRRYGFRAEGG